MSVSGLNLVTEEDSLDLQLDSLEKLELEDDELELDLPESPPSETVQQLPESAFIDGPQQSTRDLLLNALEVFGDDGLDDLSEVRPRNKKPYTFLDDSASYTERRSSMRFPLALEGELIFTNRRRVPMSITSGSSDAFYVRTAHPLPLETVVIVELVILGSYRHRIRSVVIRTTDTGFAIQLEPDLKTRAFRAAFIELARQTSLQLPKVRIEVTRENPSKPEETQVEDIDELGTAWLEVLDSPHDDEVHQKFIHACMRAQDLEYAVKRYRQQSEDGDKRAQKYLDQLGMILGFYNLAIRDDTPLEADGYTVGRTKGLVALGLTLILAVGFAQWLLKRPLPTRETPRDVRDSAGGLIHINWDFND